MTKGDLQDPYRVSRHRSKKQQTQKCFGWGGVRKCCLKCPLECLVLPVRAHVSVASLPPEMGQLLVRAPLCHLYQALPYAAKGEWAGTGRLKAGFTLKLFSRYENHREPDPISLLLWAISGENVGFLYFPTHFCSTAIAFWSLNTQHHPGWMLPQQDKPCSPCLRARGMRVL